MSIKRSWRLLVVARPVQSVSNYGPRVLRDWPARVHVGVLNAAKQRAERTEESWKLVVLPHYSGVKFSEQVLNLLQDYLSVLPRIRNSHSRIVGPPKVTA